MKRILRFGLFFKAAAIAVIVLLMKFVTDHYGLSHVAINTLTSSFCAGVFFTISILFTAAITDFKEAQKIPGEMAVVLKALHTDSLLAISCDPHNSETKNTVSHVEDLLSAITDNLRNNHWHKKQIDQQINLMNAGISDLWHKNVAPGLLLKLRDNLTSMDRLSHRLDYIAYTNDIPGASLIADIALAAVFLIFVFAQNEWGWGGLVLFAAVTFVLSSIMLLIHDMDNPFEYGRNTLADVDVSVLFRLDALWRNTTDACSLEK